MNKTRKLMIIVASLVVATTLVSAGALSYFGRVHTTINVQQSIVVGEKIEDQIVWHNWNSVINRDIPEMVHCTDYCYKLWLWNRACVDARVWFEEQGNTSDIDITHYVFGDSQTIRLVQKNVVWNQSPWTELERGMEANLTFNTCGEKLTWNIESKADLSGYVLIYYANYPEYWEGAPATIVLGGLSGSVDVPTMPYLDDENSLRPISEENETYNHQYGAKFWLVPATAVTDGEINWDMAGDFLFETDLGFYLDCDNMKPSCMKNVYDAFTTNILKKGQKYCWISCYHISFYTEGGEHIFDTLVNAEPVNA